MSANYSLSDFIRDPVFPKTVLSYSNPKVVTKRFYTLKNGQISWLAKLDLQGFKTEAARETLIQFIQVQTQQQERCVLIVHGKDSHRGAPPLIKNLINQWLPQFEEVVAFHSAQPQDGGFGAVYVLLKKVARTDLPTRLPKGHESSFLVAETKAMERKRRLAEQQGERQLAPVKAREHKEEVNSSPEGELQNNILQHPELDNQRFDGIDPNLNPEPPLNTEARKEFDNEKREQDKEKQLRLGNMPKFSSTPTPRGP